MDCFKEIVDTGYEIMIAIKRSMINYFSDQTKQNAMNLFLGKYKINSAMQFYLILTYQKKPHNFMSD